MRAAVVALAVLGCLSLPVSAHAEDTRPCVSRPEFRTTQGLAYMNGRVNPGPRLTRRQLEWQWEVAGLGVKDPEFSDAHGDMWLYPTCGYSLAEAQAWVVFNRDGLAVAAYRWYEPGATGNGHEW